MPMPSFVVRAWKFNQVLDNNILEEFSHAGGFQNNLSIKKIASMHEAD